VFTGIVQHLGRVDSVEPGPAGTTLAVAAAGWTHRPAPGDSIAVNGCCLTVRGGDGRLVFDVIRQTLDLTTLGRLVAGDPVNLEPAVTPQTLMSGHLVQGHVDGVGTVVRARTDPADYRLRIAPPASLREVIVAQGSIAVDGVSLTVARLDDAWFEVALIPATLELTNLGRLREGDRVNLEADYVAKIVVGWTKAALGRAQG